MPTVEEEIAAKFAGIEAPVEETETAEESPEEQVEAEETEALLAGKYKDVGELERAYNEMQEVLGRQGTELGQLRELKTEFEGLRSDFQQAQEPQFDPSSLEGFLIENPNQIPDVAKLAMQRNDPIAYQTAMKAWQDVDSLGASDFHSRALVEAAKAELRQELQPVVSGVQRQQTQSDFQTAYEAGAGKHEDFAQVLNSISEDTLRGFPPEALAALQTGDMQSKERVLELLYRYTKADQIGTVSEAAKNATAEAQLAARQDKAAATVASQTGSLDREQEPPPTWKDAFRDSDAFKRASGELKHR